LEIRIEYGYANGKTKTDRIRATGTSEKAGKNDTDYVTIMTNKEI
jgi:hypothetical protein